MVRWMGFAPISPASQTGALSNWATHLNNWSERQELHLRSLGPKPSALAATLRSEKMGAGAGVAPTGTLAYETKWNLVLPA